MANRLSHKSVAAAPQHPHTYTGHVATQVKAGVFAPCPAGEHRHPEGASRWLHCPLTRQCGAAYARTCTAGRRAKGWHEMRRAAGWGTGQPRLDVLEWGDAGMGEGGYLWGMLGTWAWSRFLICQSGHSYHNCILHPNAEGHGLHPQTHMYVHCGPLS